MFLNIITAIFHADDFPLYSPLSYSKQIILSSTIKKVLHYFRIVSNRSVACLSSSLEASELQYNHFIFMVHSLQNSARILSYLFSIIVSIDKERVFSINELKRP